MFAATATGWGVGPGTAVVAYDDNGGLAAARLWWLLRWIGHDAVRVLDGGLAAWRAAGGEVETGPDEPAVAASTPLVARPGSLRTVTADDITAGRVGLLVDARAGRALPRRGRAGRSGRRPHPRRGQPADDGQPRRRRHVPRRRPTLRARFEAAGVVAGQPVVAYCGSGVTAAHELLALELAGLGADAALYPPSWSGWVADRRRPVER